MAAIKKKNSGAAKVESETGVLKSYTADAVSVTVKRGGQYGSWGISLSQTKSYTDEDPDELMDELIAKLDAKADEYLEAKGFSIEVPEGEEGVEAGEDDADSIHTADDADDDDGEEVTEEMIREMDRDELVAFIEENGLEVNPKKFKKTAALADAVIAAMPEEDADDDDADDDDAEVSEDDIRAMDRPELIAFIKDNDLDVDPKKFKKLPALVEAVVAALPDDSEELTEEAVREMDREELIALIKSEELSVNPKKFKKTPALADAIIEELFAEDDGVEGDDDSGFDDGFGDDE